MGIELESETRIVIGRLCAPGDPARPWWWQSSTKVDGNEIIVGGLAHTENEAILEAASSTLQLRVANGQFGAVQAKKQNVSAGGDDGHGFGG